jgi:hypothetical protein
VTGKVHKVIELRCHIPSLEPYRIIFLCDILLCVTDMNRYSVSIKIVVLRLILILLIHIL